MEKKGKYEKRITIAFKQMVDNESEGELWRNIPLARAILDDLEQAISQGLEQIDGSDRELFCRRVLEDELLPFYDVPRLTLEIASYTDACQELKKKLEAYIDTKNVPMSRLETMLGRHLKFDPVERTPEWERCIYDVESECDSRLKDEPRCMGFCFEYWSTKTAVLAQKGIEWLSPSKMNPRVMFD